MASARSVPVLATAMVVVSFFSACHRSNLVHGRQHVVKQYLAAIKANRPEKAYALLDDRVRRKVSKAEFVSRWNNSPRELQVQAAQLSSNLDRPVKTTARLSYGSGVQVKLLNQDDQGWRIEEGILMTFQTRTPQDAIRALAHALEQGNISNVLKLLAKSSRVETQQWIQRLHKSLNEEIEVSGNEARLKLGEDSWIRLVKEDGQWKILKIK